VIENLNDFGQQKMIIISESIEMNYPGILTFEIEKYSNVYTQKK
jgi:hypothetical protein